MSTPAAIAVIRHPTPDHIILVHRKDHPFWVLPGGGIDPGEQPEQAAVREAKEETGLDVEVTRTVAAYTPINRLSGPVFLYECAVVGGQMQTSDETTAIQPYRLDQLPRKLFCVHHYWIADALRQAPETIERPLFETSYWHALLFLLKFPFSSAKWLLGSRNS